MKRLVKIASLALAFVMAFSMCSCTAKPSRSGIIQNDAQSKPERPFGQETEPVITPDPVTPQPTISATPTVTSVPVDVKKDPIELSVTDLMYISELCVGLTPDAALKFLTDVLGIDDYNKTDSEFGSSGMPMERDLMELNRYINVEGVIFKSIGIHSLDSGLVYSVDYSVRETPVLAANEAHDSEGYYNKLYPSFVNGFGDPDDDYDASWIDFDSSGMSGWRDGDDCWFSMFWGMGCQSVKGNDQFVIGVECTDPESHIPEDGYGEGSNDASFVDVFKMMQGSTGLGRAMAENSIKNLFGVDIGNPKVEAGESGSTTYTYTVEVYIEGYLFNEIDIYTYNDQVFYIGFVNDRDSEDTLHEACVTLKDMAIDYLELDPYMEYPLSDDNTLFEFYDFALGEGHVLDFSAYYTDLYSSLWFAYESSETEGG